MNLLHHHESSEGRVPGSANPTLRGVDVAALASLESTLRPADHPVPGSDVKLRYERAPDGRLLRIRVGDRTYFDAVKENCFRFDDGFVVMRQAQLPNGLLRTVTANGETWVENYRWNEQTLLTEVDGVRVEYDEEQRVRACCSDGGNWFYGYSGPHLTVIDTPQGTRQIVRDDAGRPVRVRTSRSVEEVRYDEEGRRLPRREPSKEWHFDPAGRLISITDHHGRVACTYLWDHYHCLARIDGSPGEPLAAVFSLDPTGTPVRLITRRGVKRIPRDAFGENLLRHRGMPGLFSGTIDGSFVLLQHRRLDPLTGSFDAPDPWNGSAADPRRTAGFAGPLPAELAASGPYAVARNNTLSLADPTGAISDYWWLIPSALTWSYQNTLGSIFGMWLTLDVVPAMVLWFIPNLFTAFQIDDLRNWFFGKAFDVDGVSAKGFDSFGIRADGWIARAAPTAFTYQFIVNDEASDFSNLEDARLFAPDAAFRPLLYGTVLRCAPQDKTPFLLNGQRSAPARINLVNWSRCGGDAEAAIPGSLVPVFPSGGLHFGNVRRSIKPRSGEIVELEPAAGVFFGTISARAFVRANTTGLGLTPNALVLLRDGTGAAQVTRVLSATEEGGATTIRFDTTGVGLATTGIHLQGLTGPTGTEPLTPVAARAGALSATGTTGNYHVGDVLRLNRAGATVGAAVISQLEAQLALDAALPVDLGSNLNVRLASAAGSFNGTLTATGTVFHVVSGTVPTVNDGLVVGAGAAGIAVIVTAVNGQDVTVDRDLSALGGNGTAVTWQQLTPGTSVGSRADAPEAAAVLTYQPTVIRSAPNAGFVWLEGQGGHLATRRITALNYDAFVLTPGLPDANPAAFDAELFTATAPDLTNLTLATAQVLGLNAPPPSGARAFQVVELNAPPPLAPAAGATAAVTVAGDSATTTVGAVNLPNLLPSQFVLLTAGANAEAACVRRLRVTVTFSRNTALGGPGIEAVLLQTTSPPFDAVARGVNLIRVRPTTAGAPVDFPRFAAGQLVQVAWTGPTAGERFYRIRSVSGTVITCENDDDLPANFAALTGLTVTSIDVADPRTGSSRLGLDGAVIAPNQIEFSAWSPGAFPNNRIVGLAEGADVFVRRVNVAAAQPLRIVFTANPALTGPVGLSAVPAAAGGSAGYSADFTFEGASLSLLDAPITSAGTGLILAVPFVETVLRVNGRLHNGSVRVPEAHESESRELDRRQSLIDHELTHTHQSARLGPWLLAFYPLWLQELITEQATTAGLPEYSKYVAARYDPENQRLEIPDFGGVAFDKGSTVQVSQNRRVATIELGTKDGQRFALGQTALNELSSKGISNGDAQVRREEAGAVEAAEGLANVFSFLTLGGVMNVASAASYGGLIWLIIRLIQAFRRLARRESSGTVGAGGTTIAIKTGENIEGFRAEVQVSVQAGDKTVIRRVTAMNDRTLTLDRAVDLATTSVRVAPYAPSDALFADWHSYFPARVPDANKPAAIKVEAAGGRTLTLAVNDRVHVRNSSGATFNTVVTAAAAEGVAELEEPVLAANSSDEFLVAKIGEDDPIGWADQQILNRMHLGWLQYFHDPWGQILYRARPTSTAGSIFAHAARYLFGTSSWSVLIPGYFFWDNLFRRPPFGTDTSHRSRMEQEASQRSGDTYSPIGTRHGSLDFVGDVARYWLTVVGGSRDNDPPNEMINSGQQDAPGVSLQSFHPFDAGQGAAPPPSAPSAGQLPWGSVAETFAAKDNVGTLTGVGARGWIPASNFLERSSGSYVAFTRVPAAGTNFQLTARGIGSLANAQDAQSDGASTISFNITPADVAVTLAGQAVAEAATPAVIPFQRATVAVAPNGSRVYRLTVSEPGAFLNVENDLVLVAAAALHGAGASEDVEVSRFYRFNAVTRAFDSGIGKMHLPADVHIAVRRFQVTVVNIIPYRTALDAAVPAPPVTNVRPGDTGFLLVPARIAVPAAPTSAAPVTVTAEAVPANLQAFINDGGIFRLQYLADQPPEDSMAVTFTVSVGPDVASAVPVTCAVTLDPHFVLNQSGGAGFQVARGGAITLESSDGTNITLVDPVAGATPTETGAQILLQIDPAAIPGPRIVRVRDTANPLRFARRTVTVV